MYIFAVFISSSSTPFASHISQLHFYSYKIHHTANHDSASQESQNNLKHYAHANLDILVSRPRPLPNPYQSLRYGLFRAF
jgi:hypothetical protein